MNSTLQRIAPWYISVFRIVIGFLLFCHGGQKLLGWPVASESGSTIAFGTWPMWWAGAIETIAGVLLMLGIGTRVVAFIASGAMAVAYFWRHQPDGLLPLENGGEPAALFSWALLMLVFVGPGKVAVENSFQRERTASPAERRIAQPVA